VASFGDPTVIDVDGERLLDLPAKVGVNSAGAVQVCRPVSRVGPFEGLADDRHQAGVRVGHGIASG
jgi:hypothetical protein